ncbi:MAG: hypothetical protein HKM05_00025 [Spirochaetales bacterium]|nr:hypothetical protein [Spirochaetales bacterium]
MYMPLMVNIRRAVVFGGERGEGLQKSQKLALFADELLIVPEAPMATSTLVFPAGKLSEVKEKLELPRQREIPVHPVVAADCDLEAVIRDATFIVSDLLDEHLNQRIAKAGERAGVLVNVIDTKPLCNTWFMSLIETPHLLAGLSTKGQAAFFSARLRKKLEPWFARQEKEADFWIKVRQFLPSGSVMATLSTLENSWTLKLVRRALGYSTALRLAHRRIQKHLVKESPQ